MYCEKRSALLTVTWKFSLASRPQHLIFVATNSCEMVYCILIKCLYISSAKVAFLYVLRRKNLVQYCLPSCFQGKPCEMKKSFSMIGEFSKLRNLLSISTSVMQPSKFCETDFSIRSSSNDRENRSWANRAFKFVTARFVTTTNVAKS